MPCECHGNSCGCAALAFAVTSPAELLEIPLSPATRADLKKLDRPIILREGSTELTCKARSGNLLRVEIWQAKLDASFPYKDALFWGDDVGQLPETFLSSIQIMQNKKAVFIPLSAYGDLGDVKFASLEPTKDGFTLQLHGGNTAASYDATFSFSHGYLSTRTVRGREFPDERWEKTRYSFPK